MHKRNLIISADRHMMAYVRPIKYDCVGVIYEWNERAKQINETRKNVLCIIVKSDTVCKIFQFQLRCITKQVVIMSSYIHSAE